MNLPTNARTETTIAEACVDRVLAALAATQVPSGLDERLAQRIAARLALATKDGAGSAAVDSLTPEFPALRSILLHLPNPEQPRIRAVASFSYAIPAALLAVLVLLTTLTARYHSAPASTSSASIPAQHTPASHSATTAGSGSTQTQTTQFASLGTRAGQATLRTTRDLLLRAHHPSQTLSASATEFQQTANLDAVALAETRAPSRPTPLLPLTGQERLLLAAARPGGPIQVAALDQARAPGLRAAAQARQQAAIHRFVNAALAPIALSDALTSTRFREPPEIALSTPLPQPPRSLAF